MTTCRLNSDIIDAAYDLWDHQLNVFPIKFGSKDPLGQWGFQYTARLPRHCLAELTSGCNIAVMAGRTSGNLVILDCDARGSYLRVGTELRARGIDAWERNGHHGGQFWFRIAEGEVANGVCSLDGKIEIIANCKYVAAPPSLHPDGFIYEWVRKAGSLPVVSMSTINFLPVPLRLRTRPKRQPDKSKLPRVAHTVLVERDISNYVSNSEAEFAACLSLLGAGFERAEIVAIFGQFRPPHYLKQGAKQFEKFILADAQNKFTSHRYTRRSPQEQNTISRVDALDAWARGRTWSGRTGNTDRAVYLALVRRMAQEGVTPFRATIREIAEIANINRATVRFSLKRLQESGMLVWRGQHQPTGAALYALELIEDVQKHPTTIHTVTPYRVSGAILHMSHDAFSAGGLGKSALLVWETLECQPCSARQLTKILGRDRTTIKRALDKLTEVGLVQQEGDCWHSVDATEESLDRIAAVVGTMGRGQQRKETHQRERESWVVTTLRKQRRLLSIAIPEGKDASQNHQ